MRILIVDKDLQLAKIIENTLSAIGDVDIADNGQLAYEKIEEIYYDIVVCEVSFSNFNGADFVKSIRKDSLLPIIVLSHISDIDKKIEFFGLGVDDYMIKPFNVGELEARVFAILRRVNTNFNVFSYTFKNMEVNFSNKMLMINNSYVQLNRKTYEILELLVRNKDMIMTKQQIFDRIWGYYSNTVQTVVEINIFRLRKILSDFGLDKCLKTVKSTGYMWSEKM